MLFIAPQPFFQWRGSPIRVGFDAMALVRQGFEVDLLVMPYGEDRAIPGVRILRAPNPLRIPAIPIGPSPGKAVMDLFLLGKALRLAAGHRYAVVHGVEDAGPIAWLAARRCGARVVFEKHSDPVSYHGGALRNAVMWLYRQVERFSIRKADAVIGTGPALVEQVRQIDPRKPVYLIGDIPSSLAEADSARTRDIARAWRPSGGEVVALYVGSFAVYQGIDLLFRSLPLVCERLAAVRFVIVGGTEQEIAARRAEMTRAGCGAAVTFAGKIPPDELPSHLRAADILLSPRVAGSNTPLKLLDYLKAERAIAATDHPANRLILDDDTAVLARPDPRAFADAVIELAGDPARRGRLAAAGARLLREEHNFELFSRRLAACYARLAEG